MAKHRILLVDDDRDTCIVTRALLRSFGYDVAVANDGIAAVSVAGSERPHLVLLDIGLPGQSGYKVLKTLRVTPGLAEVPVVVVSAQEPFSSRDLALQFGATDFLQKPVDRDTLYATLRRLLGAAAPLPAASGAPDPGEAARHSGPPRVLVVDPDREAAAPVVDRLKARGLETLWAPDAIQALRLAQRSRPDLLVAEMQLPGGDCFDLVERLGAFDPALRSLPVVVLTERRHLHNLAHLSGYRLLGSFDRPFDPDHVVQCVADHLLSSPARP